MCIRDRDIDDSFSDTGGFNPGKMYFYQYDPVTEKLPYYDKYPLTYVIRMDNDGFLGCNLHYVTLTLRDELARSLLNNSEQGRISVPRRTLHKYLYTGIRGQLYPIPEDEWIDVAQLPISNSGGHIAHLGGAFLGFFAGNKMKKGENIFSFGKPI